MMMSKESIDFAIRSNAIEGIMITDEEYADVLSIARGEKTIDDLADKYPVHPKSDEDD